MEETKRAEFLRYVPSERRCVFLGTYGSARELSPEEKSVIQDEYSVGFKIARDGGERPTGVWRGIGWDAWHGQVDDYGQLDAAVLGGLVPDPRILDRDPMHGHDPVSGRARND